jgi:hypothetical protein
LKLQVELNTIHEDLREILIKSFQIGSSNQNRKMLIVFYFTSWNYGTYIDPHLTTPNCMKKFDSTIILKTYQNLAFNLSLVLKQLSKSIINNSTQFPHSLLKDFEDTEIVQEIIKTRKFAIWNSFDVDQYAALCWKASWKIITARTNIYFKVNLKDF